MSPNEIVLNFRSFLLASWPSIMKVLGHLDWDRYPYFIDDWIQANWELLVESRLDGEIRISPYGFNPSPETRYSNRGSIATHQVVCRHVSNDVSGVSYRFLGFTASDGKGGFKISAPFDHVNLSNRNHRELLILPLMGLEFDIEPIAK